MAEPRHSAYIRESTPETVTRLHAHTWRLLDLTARCQDCQIVAKTMLVFLVVDWRGLKIGKWRLQRPTEGSSIYQGHLYDYVFHQTSGRINECCSYDSWKSSND